MTQAYGQYKRDTRAVENRPATPQTKRPLPPLTAAQMARAKQSKADWDVHFGSTPAKNLIKDLHEAGLIDGWRDVTVTVEKDE